jgi:membrane protease YdiL (CAAX protease family)
LPRVVEAFCPECRGPLEDTSGPPIRPGSGESPNSPQRDDQTPVEELVTVGTFDNPDAANLAKDRVGTPPGEPADDEPNVEGPGWEELPPPVLPARAVWSELGAVLAVGVVPHLIRVVYAFAMPVSPPSPYWTDALYLTVVSGCSIYVTLYLVHRSEEPLGRFGLTRPAFWDVPIGVGLLFAAETLWLYACGLVSWEEGTTTSDFYPRPQQRADYALMLLKHGANGFAEELVTRAYLITRFEHLLRSRVGALLLSGVLFASYHAYQGPGGVAYMLAFAAVYGAVFLLVRRIWPLAIGHALYNIRLDLMA